MSNFSQSAVPPLRLLTYRAANMQGIGTRGRQEDSFGFANAVDVTEMRRKGLLAVLADGMGGMEDGKLVSENAVAAILSAFGEMDREGDLSRQLEECILRTGQQLYAYFHGRGGTTLIACIFFKEQLYWASVGDSFLYLLREGGLYRLNQEHNYRTQLYLEAVRDGQLDPSQANADPDGHRLSRFLGMDGLEELDRSVRPMPLQDGDVLLLCSDGVGGVLSEDAVRACLETRNPSLACAKLDEMVRAAARRSQDNYTALVVSCGY